MGRVMIVTDSTADIPPKLVSEHSITVVPLNVHFGDEVYLDGVTMTSEEFFAKFEATNILPTTSQPSPGAFLDVYRKLKSDGADTILSIHLSATLSGTYESASMAASLARNEGINVWVFDTRQASMGIGLMALRAARLAEDGASAAEILKEVEHLRRITRLYLTVDTLTYLEKNGRIGKAASLLGSILKIKPVLTLEDGIVVPIGKARGKKGALKMLLNSLGNDVPQGSRISLAVMHGNNSAGAEDLLRKVKETYEVVGEAVINCIGPVIGTHAGPGALGLIAYKEG